MAPAGSTCNIIKLQVLHGAKRKVMPSVPECVTSCQAEPEKHNSGISLQEAGPQCRVAVIFCGGHRPGSSEEMWSEMSFAVYYSGQGS